MMECGLSFLYPSTTTTPLPAVLDTVPYQTQWLHHFSKRTSSGMYAASFLGEGGNEKWVIHHYLYPQCSLFVHMTILYDFFKSQVTYHVLMCNLHLLPQRTWCFFLCDLKPILMQFYCYNNLWSREQCLSHWLILCVAHFISKTYNAYFFKKSSTLRSSTNESFYNSWWIQWNVWGNVPWNPYGEPSFIADQPDNFAHMKAKREAVRLDSKTM